MLLSLPVAGHQCNVQFLEHVVLHVSVELGGAHHTYSKYDYIVLKLRGEKNALKKLIQHTDVRRGDVTITLRSPSGVTSHLLPHRPRDFINSVGYRKWPFMSVLHWGEQPCGVWLVNISYTPGPHSQRQGYAIVHGLELSLYGTVLQAESLLTIPRYCHQQCARTCGGAGPFMCDTCKSLRNTKTLECVEECSEEDGQHKRYCLPSVNNTSHLTSSSSPPSSTVMEDPSILSLPPHPSHYHILNSHKSSAILNSPSEALVLASTLVAVLFVIL